MAFNQSPLVDFSSVGLITDVPTHSLPRGAWNDCQDLRCKNGSVQGVNAFVDDVVLHDSNAVISGGSAVALTQYTPAGTDYLVLVYIVDGTDGFCHVVTYNTSTLVYNDITSSVTNLKFTYNDTYPPQVFVFNELLIVNPANDAPPMYSDAGAAAATLAILPNWPTDSDTAPVITRSLKPFDSRLMAMNIFEEHTAGTADDIYLPIDILWSSHITSIGSLTAAEWTASSTNTAGDAFAVDTQGKILDGGQLGEYFIAYKSDSVVRVAETGDTFILSFESIFEDDGIYSSRCFANIGGAQHLVIGNYGVYIHDGQSSKLDIAKGLFQDTIFNLVKPSEKERAFCFQQTRDKEVWFCYPSSSNTTLGCDAAFVYDYNEQKLHKRSLPGLSDIYETELDGELAIYAAEPSGTTLQVLSNTAYVADGWFIKEDDNLIDNTAVKQINSVGVNSVGSVNIALTATHHLNDAKAYTYVAFDPTTEWKVDVRATGRYMNLKVKMDGTTNPKLGKLQFNVRLAGKR